MVKNSKENQHALNGVIAKSGDMTYPGRIYGKYVWDDVAKKWEISPDWDTENNCFRASFYQK